MRIAEVRERLGRNFRPFVIRLSDGRRIRVPSADHIAVGKTVVAVIGDDEISRALDPLQIVSIDESSLPS